MDQTTPANEPARLEALKSYAIVDTLPEAGFDEITELAAQICDCPVALVSFVDASRQWMKAKYRPASGGTVRMPARNFGLQGHGLRRRHPPRSRPDHRTNDLTPVRW